MENEIKILSSVNCICLIWIVCLYYCFIFRVSIVVASIIIIIIYTLTAAELYTVHTVVDDILSSLLYCLYLPGEKFHISGYIIFKGKLGKINSIKIIMCFRYDSVAVARLLYPCVNIKRVLLWWQQKVFNWMSSLICEGRASASHTIILFLHIHPWMHNTKRRHYVN